MPPGSAATASVLREAEAWASAQCELLSGVEAMWTGWMQRQREAIDASAPGLSRRSANAATSPTSSRSSSNGSPTRLGRPRPT
jgi:hypothetical protein